MAQKPEVKVKKNIDKIIAIYGGRMDNNVMTGMATNGRHDKIATFGMLSMSVEAKAGRGRLTPLQAVYGEEVWSSGGMAVVVNEEYLQHFDDVCRVLSGHDKISLLEKNWGAVIPERKGPFEKATYLELFRVLVYRAMWLPHLTSDKLQTLGTSKEMEAMLGEKLDADTPTQ